MMDLNNFPTNATAQDMLEMVSPIYDEAYVAKWLFQVIGAAVHDAKLLVDQMRKEEMPETCNLTMMYWEELYSIATNTSLPIEKRRADLLARRKFRKPMSPAKIEQIVNTLTGHSVHITENIADYTFGMTVDASDSPVPFTSVIKTVKELKPSHTSMAVLSEMVENHYISCGAFAAISIPKTAVSY